MDKMYIIYMTALPLGPHEVEINVTDARGQLSELLDTRVRDGDVVYLTRYGRRVGAVVPADVAERLAELEDAYWSRRAADVLANGEPTVPWDEAVAMLESGDADR
jgi:prevent-host-death family protein